MESKEKTYYKRIFDNLPERTQVKLLDMMISRLNDDQIESFIMNDIPGDLADQSDLMLEEITCIKEKHERMVKILELSVACIDFFTPNLFDKIISKILFKRCPEEFKDEVNLCCSMALTIHKGK